MSGTKCVVAALATVVGAGAAWAIEPPVVLDTGAAATIGTVVTINGSGFGTRKPTVRLYATDNIHGPVKLKVTAFSDTQVTGTVTKLYTVAQFAGPYDVDVGPADKSALHTTYQGALAVSVGQIGTITPGNPAPGGAVGIDGTLFGAKKGKVVVGGKAAKVVKWTPTHVDAVLSKKTPTGPQTMTITNKLGDAVKTNAVAVTDPSQSMTTRLAGRFVHGAGHPRPEVFLAEFPDLSVQPKGIGYDVVGTKTIASSNATYVFEIDLSNFDLVHAPVGVSTVEPALFQVKETSPSSTTWQAAPGQVQLKILRSAQDSYRATFTVTLSPVVGGADPTSLQISAGELVITFT